MLAAGCDASDRLESKVKRSSSGAGRRRAAPRAPGAALLLRGRRPRAAQMAAAIRYDAGRRALLRPSGMRR
jgi:hypothetical protein